MVKSKVEVLLTISEVNLGRAEKRFSDGEYDSAVFHASTATESAANALILALGGDEAKNHRAISGLAAVVRRIKPQWSTERTFVELIDRGREIQREVVYTRYPLKVAGDWMTPMEYYTRDKARKIINNAKFAVNTTKEYIKRTTMKT